MADGDAAGEAADQAKLTQSVPDRQAQDLAFASQPRIRSCAWPPLKAAAAKPRVEVYVHAAEQAGMKPAELALVAAHPWNINGAAAVGLVTAYLSADRPYSGVMRSPDLEAGTLPELARRLAGL